MSDTILIVIVLAVAIVIVSIVGCMALVRIGEAAFKSAAAPGSATSFVSFFLQCVRIAAVGLIVLAALTLSYWGKLEKGEIGFLSSIAGFMLGASAKSLPRGSTRPSNKE